MWELVKSDHIENISMSLKIYQHKFLSISCKHFLMNNSLKIQKSIVLDF